MPLCTACQIDVSDINEYSYMLRHDLWTGIHGCLPWEGGIWCVGCLEHKMGRKLTHGDFDWDNGLNKPWGPDSWEMRHSPWSNRLKNRREN